MKRNLTVAAALSIAALCQARDVRSPNGSYAIRVENSISLVDLESGSTLLGMGAEFYESCDCGR